MRPIVHGYFLCYNEEYILPHLLKYYSSICDKIYILDNESTDNSHDIIKSFNNTEIISWNSGNEVRDDLYLELKNNVWKQSRGIANYVIVGDADEILYHLNMNKFLEESLINGYTIFKSEGYHMIGDKDLILSSTDSLLELVTDGIKGSSNDKLMLFNCNEITEINYSPGCHNANPTGNVKYYNTSELKMLHYKYLGLNDFIPKQLIRGKRLSEINKRNGWGSYYLFDAKQHEDEYETFIIRRVKVI